MYEQYWKLKNRPFHNTPDPQFYYHSSQHDEALMKLSYAVNENMGAALLTGAYGCGKTMLSKVLVEQLGRAYLAVNSMAQPSMTPLDLLRSVARELAEDGLPTNRSELVADALLEIIERALKENARDGKQTVLIIDEAHMIESAAVLELVRLLLNFQDKSRFLLNILLVGHPELAERVGSLKQLAQRVPITCTLKPFDLDETIGYVGSRLNVAGCTESPFKDDALRLIHRNAGGIPRRINTLCDVSLALGFAQRVTAIEAALVLEAAEKFGVA